MSKLKRIFMLRNKSQTDMSHSNVLGKGYTFWWKKHNFGKCVLFHPCGLVTLGAKKIPNPKGKKSDFFCKSNHYKIVFVSKRGQYYFSFFVWSLPIYPLPRYVFTWAMIKYPNWKREIGSKVGHVGGPMGGGRAGRTRGKKPESIVFSSYRQKKSKLPWTPLVRPKCGNFQTPQRSN